MRGKSDDSPIQTSEDKPSVSTDSHHSNKIALFRSMFKGREDVYPKRFESLKTSRSGYQPACGNEWISGICEKPKIKCADCKNRDFIPITDEVIRNHLLGYDPDVAGQRDFTIGVYPLLPDETCHFLAVDFDKSTWQEDALAYLKTCREYQVPAIFERSRSGDGGHIWIFFSEQIPASMARRMGTFILTETMELRPGVGFDSYDRFFPNQDTMPKGGFGNLIALPLQAKPREQDNSVFVDNNFTPYHDQWSFLSSVDKMDLTQVESIVEIAIRRGRIVGVRKIITDEKDEKPWTAPPSRKRKDQPIVGDLPKEIELVFGNQIYIEKKGLPPALLNRLIRLAAFQNPEFYKTQAMRLSTWNKPRIIACHEEFPKHIGLPRGCLEDVLELLNALSVKTKIIDERYSGELLRVNFQGDIRPQQENAVQALLKHNNGVLSAATAFGKTVIGIYMLAKRKVNTLILVHRRQLMDQWIARIEMFLDIDPVDIGQIGGGKWKPTGKIDVAMIQSLSKKGEVNDIVGDYGHLIVDECHHISARSFEIVARQSKAKYILGLSATVTRKDGHHPIIFMNIGPIRYSVSHRKQAIERPFSHKVVFKETDFKMQLGSTRNNLQIHEIYSALSDNNNRNQLIVNDVINAVKNGRSPVVLTERREHLKRLESLLSSVIKNVIVFRGGMGKKQRRSTMEELQNITEDEERVILATGRYLGEGFDDARLDTLFLTMPVSWKGVLAQYAGRLHRLYDQKKEVVIYDYVDKSVPMLVRMYKRRLGGYGSIGYKCGDITPNVRSQKDQNH
ncbi:MAG: DEAD/DEAH box helicase family protein [Planctomycetia bacterium]|nr:DEAD/DEAH box helicase family protein [Planctomycetia bacterium]